MTPKGAIFNVQDIPALLEEGRERVSLKKVFRNPVRLPAFTLPGNETALP